MCIMISYRCCVVGEDDSDARGAASTERTVHVFTDRGRAQIVGGRVDRVVSGIERVRRIGRTPRSDVAAPHYAAERAFRTAQAASTRRAGGDKVKRNRDGTRGVRGMVRRGRRKP